MEAHEAKVIDPLIYQVCEKVLLLGVHFCLVITTGRNFMDVSGGIGDAYIAKYFVVPM